MQNSYNNCTQMTSSFGSALVESGNIAFPNFPTPQGYIACVNNSCVECFHVYFADIKEWKLMCRRFTRSSPTDINI